jgi:hypothetical protein
MQLDRQPHYVVLHLLLLLLEPLLQQQRLLLLHLGCSAVLYCCWGPVCWQHRPLGWVQVHAGL